MKKEEAIRDIKRFMRILPNDMQEAIMVLVPELTDSEDERIRKHIVKFIDEQYPTHGSLKEEKDKMLAYLEKQKEQKPAEWSEDIIQKAVKEVGLTQYQIDWFKTNVFQPKREWSEEDEAAWGDLMWCIEQARKSAKDENDMGNIWFAENWVKNRLESLRPQGSKDSLQPHWKPSEEMKQNYIRKDALLEIIKEESKFWDDGEMIFRSLVDKINSM